MSRPPNPQLIETIQNIVAEEIQTKGTEGVTLRLIAQRAGITPTTIYYYFKNKEELFDKIKFNVTRNLHDYILARVDPQASAKDQFQMLIQAFIDWSIAHPKLLDLVFETLPPKTDLRRSELEALYQSQYRIIAIIEQKIKEGELKVVNPQLDSTILIGLVYGVVKLYLNKRVLPEYWDDITPLQDRMMEIIYQIIF